MKNNSQVIKKSLAIKISLMLKRRRLCMENQRIFLSRMHFNSETETDSSIGVDTKTNEKQEFREGEMVNF